MILYIITAIAVALVAVIIYLEHFKTEAKVENTLLFDFDQMYGNSLIKNIRNLHYIYQCEVIDGFDLNKYIVNVHINYETHQMLVFLGNKTINLTTDSQNFLKSVLLFDIDYKKSSLNPCSMHQDDLFLPESPYL